MANKKKKKKKKMPAGIYAVVNRITNKRYVGSAKNLAKRRREHFYRLGSGGHHSIKLQRSFLKHGVAAFDFEVLLHCAPEMLIFYEQRAIDAYQAAGARGYNMRANASSNLGYSWSEEAKIPLRGVKRSPEACARMRAAAAESRCRRLQGGPVMPRRTAPGRGLHEEKQLLQSAL